MAKGSVVLPVKLSPPRLDAGIIDRPRLLESAVQLGRQSGIVILTAPAGYGKTVLMRQLCDAIPKPLVWYQLDKYDNDLSAFLHNLAIGIDEHFPGFRAAVLPSLNESGAKGRTQRLITAICKRIVSFAEEGFILALDDYHAVTEPKMHAFLAEFLAGLPAVLHICLAGRTIPPLPLARLAASRTIAKVSGEEIRFTREEVAVYLGQRGQGPPPSVIERVAEETEGWPVALRLIRDAVPADTGPVLLPDKSSRLFDYFAQEVWQRQPPLRRQFLSATSVLDVLTPEACDLLLERNDSGLVLDDLEREQIFLIPLARPGAFRYHQLFRDFLLERLGQERETYFHRAGTVAERLGGIETAIECFYSAGAVDEAVRLIKARGKEALRQGRWWTVRRWLAELPRESSRKEPWLILYRAEVAICRGNLAEAERLLPEAQRLFAAKRDETGLTEVLIQDARLLRSRGRYEESIERLDRALLRLLPEDLRERFDFSLEKSFALVLAGKFTESEAVLKEALGSAEVENDGYLTANFAEALSNLYFLQGNYAKSLEMYRQAVDASREQVLTSYYMRDSVALIYRDWGELDRAYEHATRGVAAKEKLGAIEALPYAYYQLACIQVDRGELRQAEDSFRRSIRIARESGGEQVFLIMSLAMLAKLLLAGNRLTEARALAEESLAMSRTQSDYVAAFAKEMAAPVLMQTGDPGEAVRMLFESAAVLERIGAKYPLCIACGVLAALCTARGDNAAAADYARKCLELAARENYIQIFLGSYALFQPNLRFGLATGTAVGFVQRILARLGPKALELLMDTAADADPAIRLRSILPLAEIGGSQARKIMRVLVNDPAPEVRELARQVAARQGLAETGASAKAAIPALRLEMLGRFRVFTEGGELGAAAWTTVKARDLLAYLAHCGEAVAKERILADLWPDLPYEKSSPLFHTTLYYLRQNLERACRRRDIILYRGGSCLLSAGSHVTDREHLEELFGAAARAGSPPETVIACLEEAAGLFRGKYLEDIDYPWLISQREHLDCLHREALLRLSGLHLGRKDYAPALRSLRSLLESDPYSEEAVCLLMRAQAGSGNLQAVSAAYRELAAALHEELGVEPAASTRDLYRQLSADAGRG